MCKHRNADYTYLWDTGRLHSSLDSRKAWQGWAMMEVNPNDLFHEYNKRLSEEIRRRQVKDVVVIGPPKSGKTFFIRNYLSDLNVIEETVGILSVEVDELNLKDRVKSSLPN